MLSKKDTHSLKLNAYALLKHICWVKLTDSLFESNPKIGGRNVAFEVSGNMNNR